MTIIKAKDFIQAYQARAMASDIHELSGRGIRKDLTQFINKQIIAVLNFNTNDIVVDIGCGDGSLSATVVEMVKTVYAIVPTQEECNRLRQSYSNSNLHFSTGLVQNIPFQTSTATKVVCNGVIPLLSSLSNVNQALQEISKISKKDALIWIGEVMDIDEFAENSHRNFGDSILKWLIYVLRYKGIQAFIHSVSFVIKSLLTYEPFVIQPKKFFYTQPSEFIEIARHQGLRVVWYGKHKELNASGHVVESSSRTDYLFVKEL